MAVVDQFLLVVDRLAKQRDLIGQAAEDASAPDPSSRYFLEDVLVTGDADFINRLGSAASIIDNYLDRDGIIGISTPSEGQLAFCWYGGLIEGIGDWLSADIGQSIDYYLQEEVVEVSEYFDQLWFSIYHFHLRSWNVFCEQTFNFAVVEVTAVFPLTATIQSSERLGTGSGFAGGTGATKNFAAGRILTTVSTQAIGASNLVMDVTLVKPDGTTEVQEVSYVGGSLVGSTAYAGGVNDVYLEISSVDASSGNLGDELTFTHVKPRSIAL